MLQTPFSRRAFRGELGTQRAFQGHLKGTLRSLQEDSKSTWVLKGHLSTRGFEALKGQWDT